MAISSRLRPNRLGYILIGLTTFSLALYTFSSYPSSFSLTRSGSSSSSRTFSPLSHLPHPQPHPTVPFDRETYEPQNDIPLILEESTNKAEYQQQGLRITLAQIYENTRLTILGLDEEGGGREEEGHEDYIYRLSSFTKNYFEGSVGQGYLRLMLANLDLHISPPLLKTGFRKGIIGIRPGSVSGGTGGAKREVGSRWTKNRDNARGLKRDSILSVSASAEMGGWEDNTWDSNDLDRVQERLAKGSQRLEALWGNLTRVEEQTIYVKHLSLLLWGGAYIEGEGSITDMTPISDLASSATQILHSALQRSRSSLQPMTPPPPVPPEFIPPSLDPNWTKIAQSPDEKVVSLVLVRQAMPSGRSGSGGMTILRSDTIMAKAFHPVFMDVLDILSRRVDGEYIRLKGDGKAFDSSVLNLDQTLLLEEAVDRYLRIQYGTTLAEVDRVAGDEAVIVGDVLFLPPKQVTVEGQRRG